MPQCGFLQIDLAVQGHAVRFKAFVAQFDGRPVQLGIERILSKTRSGEIDRSSLDLKLITQRIKDARSAFDECAVRPEKADQIDVRIDEQGFRFHPELSDPSFCLPTDIAHIGNQTIGEVQHAGIEEFRGDPFGRRTAELL